MLGYLDLQMLLKTAPHFFSTFNINITKRDNTKTGYRVQLRYLLDQKYAKELLTLIKNLFNHGKVILRKEDMYRYYCDTFVGHYYIF